MHYFKRNIGDYHKKAGRLSMLEHGAYTLLIDAYYDREQAPTKQEAIDWCWARSPEEIAAVEFLLSKFFTLEGDVYIQTRIEEELANYTTKSLVNKRIAKEREANKRAQKARTVHEPSPDKHETAPNHKPLTTNHKPLTTKQRPPGDKSPDRFDEFWNAYSDKRGRDGALKVWNRKKLNNIANDVIDGAKRYVKARGEDKQFWKQAQGWLNDGRWKDDHQSSKPTVSAFRELEG